MSKVLVFRHVPHEGLGTLEPFLNSRKISIQYCDLSGNNPVPQDPASYELVISMGGPMNADEVDKYPFLGEERKFLTKAIGQGTSVIGICLGSQLIARALGAKVYPGPQKEIGWFPIRLTADGQKDPMLKFIGKEAHVFHWHGDTFDLPKGAVRLASSDLCPNQAFRFNRNVYAFQYHVEITPQMVSSWADHGKSELAGLRPPLAKEKLVQETAKFMGSLGQITDKIYPALFDHLVKSEN